MVSKTTGGETTRVNLDDTEWYRGELGNASDNFKARASAIVNVPKIITGGTALRRDADRWGQFDVNAVEFGDIYNNARSVIQAAIDYCKANGIRRLRIPRSDANGGSWLLDGPIFIDDPANLRSGISLANQLLGVTAAPTVFDVGLEFICDFGTTFITSGNWQTAPVIWIGTSTYNRIRGATVIGPRGGLGIDYRQLDPRCTAFAIASGNGGAADTVLEDCFCYDVYHGCTFGQNGESALAEDNRLINCAFAANVAVKAINGQALVNMIVGGNYTGKLTTFSSVGQQITVFDGEYGCADQQCITITVSGASALTGFSDALTGGTSFTNYTFTVNVTPNAIYSVLLDGTFYYNTAVFHLPSFGFVPCVQTAYSAGVITFKLDLGWLYFHFGEEVALKGGTDFETELAALTSMDIGQRATVATGSVAMFNGHIETSQCLALYDGSANGDRAVFTNMDFTNWHPGVTDMDTPTKHINMHHPWARQKNGDLIFHDCKGITHPSDSTTDGVTIQVFDYPNDQSFSRFIVSGSIGFSRVNLRYAGDATAGSGGAPLARGIGYDDTLTSAASYATKAFGFGEFDFPVWAPRTAAITLPTLARMGGTSRTKFHGTRPAPSEHQRLTSADVSALTTLTGTIPQVCGGSLNSIAQLGGQGATHVIDVGGAGLSFYTDIDIDWSYKGQSQIVNVTSSTDNIFLKLFNGQEIGLDNGGGVVWYIITGCYLADGYITVYRESTSLSVLAGTKTTTYTGGTIKQRAPVLSFPGQTRTARVSTQFVKSSDAALADIPGLSLNVFTGLNYKFRAVLFTTSNTSGGVKASISGTVAATSIIYEAATYQGGVDVATGTARSVGLSVGVGDVTAVTTARIEITGTISVSASGTLTVQFAQNASNINPSNVLVGSFMELIEIP